MTKRLIQFILSLSLLTTILINNTNSQNPVNPTTIPEYDSVAAVIMFWNPYNNTAYDEIVVQVIDGIQTQAIVYLQTNSESHRTNMINVLSGNNVPLENIIFIDVDGYRIWIRDHGPFSIYDDGELAFIGFNDFASDHGDKDLTYRLSQYWDINYYGLMHVIFDGGNYLIDSHSRLFATDRLYSNNPCQTEEQINKMLSNYMGIKEVFLFNALTNDYWGHIDMQIKLLNDSTFVISSVDHGHADYTVLEENYQSLNALVHPDGINYSVHKILKAENWKTYINSLIVNDVVLVPIYGHERDAAALQTYEELLPEKTIIGINCNAMIHWEGAIHCITNQIPPFIQTEDDDDDDDNGDEPNILENTPSENAFNLSVYPNPAAEFTMLEFEVSEKGNYTLSITDLQGKEYRSSVIPAYAITKHSMYLDLSGLPSGVYVISLSGNRKAQSVRFVKN